MMNENKRFDENDEGYKKLIEACLMCEQEYLDSLHLDELPDFKPSERHNKKMQRLLKSLRRPQHRFWRSAWGKAAAIFIAIFLIFGSSAAVAEAFGIPVFQFIETAFEKFTELFVDKSEITEYPTTIEGVYTLTGLPEGFVETECVKDDVSVETVWKNGDIVIKLYQSTLDGKITIDTEDSNNIKTEHEGKEVIYTSKNNQTRIIWHNGKYRFSLRYNEEKTLEEMIKMIDSVITVSEQEKTE